MLCKRVRWGCKESMHGVVTVGISLKWRANVLINIYVQHTNDERGPLLLFMTRCFRILVPLVTPSSRWCSARTARPLWPACVSAPLLGSSGWSYGRLWERPPADGSSELCTACSAPCTYPGTVSWSASPASAERKTNKRPPNHRWVLLLEHSGNKNMKQLTVG